MMLVHLLHPNTLRRLVDASEYGNTYALAEMMTDLTDAIFAADRAGSVNTYRQNLQQAYVEMLAGWPPANAAIASTPLSMAVYELDRVRKGLALTSGDTGTKAHRTALKLKIDRALSTEGWSGRNDGEAAWGDLRRFSLRGAKTGLPTPAQALLFCALVLWSRSSSPRAPSTTWTCSWRPVPTC